MPDKTPQDNYTKRGFRIYDEFKDTYEGEISIVESSAVIPRVWIQTEVKEIDGLHIANAHLSPEQALRVAAALTNFATEHPETFPNGMTPKLATSPAVQPNPDSEGGLDAIIDDILDDLEFMGTTSCQKKAKLKALIHRREQEKYDEGLADGLGGKLYKQINITEEVNIPQELRRNIEAEYAIKALNKYLLSVPVDAPEYSYIKSGIEREIHFIEQHRTKQ